MSAVPTLWPGADGEPVSCREKVKVLTENHAEAEQVLRDAFEDAILMGVELFGADSTLYVAGACVAAYLIIGHRSVYPEQQIAYSKSSWIFARADLPVGQEKVRLSYGLLRWWRMRRKRAHRTDRNDA